MGGGGLEEVRGWGEELGLEGEGGGAGADGGSGGGPG